MTRLAQKPVLLPVTLKQKYLLDQAVHPDTLDDLRDRWLLTYAFFIEPKVDMRRLRRAVQKLCKRHDLLRLRFERTKNTWRAEIDPSPPDVIRQVPLGDVDAQTLEAKISELANASMPLVGQHLFEVLVVTSAAHKDVVILRLHHAITDGYGMVVLIEDFAKYLLGLPILSKAVPFAEYVARYQSPLPSQAARIGAFWDKMHADLPQAPNFGRKAKGLTPNFYTRKAIDQRQLDITVAPENMRRFEAQAAKDSISPTTKTFCAYLETMCTHYALDRMVFTTHINRTDPALDTYIGDHTLDVVVPFQPLGPGRFTESSAALRDMLLDVMAHLPTDTARRGTPYEAALVEAGCFPGQISLYHPRVITRQNRSMFGEGFRTAFGEKSPVGPYTLTQIDANERRRMTFEMQLSLSPSTPPTGFTIHFDAIAYTDDEIREISDKMCAVLELQPFEIKVW